MDRDKDLLEKPGAVESPDPAALPHASSPPNQSPASDLNDHNATTTCADDPRSWVELLDRLGSLPRLGSALSESLALLRRTYGAEAAAVFRLSGDSIQEIASCGRSLRENLTAPLAARAGTDRPVYTDSLALLKLACDGGSSWLLVLQGPKAATLKAGRDRNLAVLTCALKAYEAAAPRAQAERQPPAKVLTERHAKLLQRFPTVVTRNPELLEVLALVETFAPTDFPILIQGESGTGKELIAEAIHRASLRASGPFVSENCAAIPESLAEAEFFGVEKGAYTGATSSRPGLLQLANNGTLFLDEVGDMAPSLQRKLLRVLQEKKLRRVGANTTQEVDVRIISATNRNMEELVTCGAFRADLYFRLNAVMLRIPPLRERPEDIVPLAEYFLQNFARTGGRRVRLSAEARAVLETYRWPGNVRELRNEIMRSAVLAQNGTILPSHFSPTLTRTSKSPIAGKFLQGRQTLFDYERATVGALIREVLKSVNGNKSACAKILGIPKTTLYRRMERYGIRHGDDKERAAALKTMAHEKHQ